MKIDYYLFGPMDAYLGVPWLRWYWEKEHKLTAFERFNVERAQKDIEFAKFIGKALFWNPKNGKIYVDEKYKQRVRNLNGATVYPRSRLGEVDFVTASIEQYGGKSVTTFDDMASIECWPMFIQPEHRAVKMSHLNLAFDDIKREIEQNGKVFLKTIEKGVHGVLTDINLATNLVGFELVGMKPGKVKLEQVSANDVYELTGTINGIDGKNRKYLRNHEKYLPGDTPIMWAKAIEPLRTDDERNEKLEYRGFIVGGEIEPNGMDFYFSENGSRPVRDEVNERALNIVNKLAKTKFPKTYVLDLIDTTDGLDISEFNPTTGAGCGENNDFMFHDRERNITLEN